MTQMNQNPEHSASTNPSAANPSAANPSAINPDNTPSTGKRQRSKKRGKKPKPKLPLWRFIVPLAVQVAIVLSIPAQKVMTITSGSTVYLQTAPVDPYDLLRGRYVTLNYEIAQRSLLETLPGWSDDLATRGEDVYVVLQPPTVPQAREPWQAIAVSNTPPETLESGHQFIKGTWRGWNLDLGLGAYYIPEAIGDALEDDIAANREDTWTEVKVDGRGKTALVGLWVEDREY